MAITAKEAARNNIAKLLLEKDRKSFFGRSEPTVRVNSVDSGLCQQDLDVVLQHVPNGIIPSSLHLPKVGFRKLINIFSCSGGVTAHTP